MFSNNEVTAMLKSSFIEGRLHTDMTPAMPGYAKYNARIQAVRTQYLGAGNLGLPHYFVLNPADLDTPLAHRSGKASIKVFKDFFVAAQAKASKSGGE